MREVLVFIKTLNVFTLNLRVEVLTRCDQKIFVLSTVWHYHSLYRVLW